MLLPLSGETLPSSLLHTRSSHQVTKPAVGVACVWLTGSYTVVWSSIIRKQTSVKVTKNFERFCVWNVCLLFLQLGSARRSCDLQQFMFWDEMNPPLFLLQCMVDVCFTCFWCCGRSLKQVGHYPWLQPQEWTWRTWGASAVTCLGRWTWWSGTWTRWDWRSTSPAPNLHTHTAAAAVTHVSS